MDYSESFTVNDSVTEYHFVLVLDDSFSMESHWEKLMEAVTIFCNARHGFDDYISVILFDDDTTVPIKNEKITNTIVNKIKFGGGTTDFSKAIDTAINVINDGFQTLSLKDKACVMIFLTDGSATYPQVSLLNYKNKFAQKSLETYFIAFGDEDFSVLKQMNVFLYGDDERHFKPCNDKNDLCQMFKTIGESY